MTPIKEVFSTICKLLNKHQVDYLVVGGFAVIYHGFSRATDDVDFWYKPTNDNFIKIIAAFEDLKMDVSQLKEMIFDPKKTFLRIPVYGVDIEFLPGILGGVTFTDAKKNALITKIDGVEVSIIGYGDLIRIKKATDRPKDRLDIEELEKKKKERINKKQ